MDVQHASAQPIGIFDSGLGGLTVARAIAAALPDEPLVYLGDTARVPYGTKSADTVLRYARACAKKLLEHDPKVLVVACNTVSAVALDALSAELSIPVLGVIRPGARAGLAASKTKRIGVLATAGTIASGAYPRAIAELDPNALVFAQAAPLLVPLVEEGWTEGEVPSLAARRYLAPLVEGHIDTLVLGCTHYPLLAGALQEALLTLSTHEVHVVDSATATASELVSLLKRKHEKATGIGGSLRILATDLPRRFEDMASRFLGAGAVTGVEIVDL